MEELNGHVNPSSGGRRTKILVVVLVVVLFAWAGVIGYWLGVQRDENNIGISPSANVAVAPLLDAAPPSGLQPAMDEGVNWVKSKDYYPDANWFTPKPLPSLRLFAGQAWESRGFDEYVDYLPYDDNTAYFLVGTTTYKGEVVNILFVSGYGTDYAFFLETKSGYVLLTKNSNFSAVDFPTSSPAYDPNMVKPYSVDQSFVLASLLKFPKKINGNVRQELTLYQVFPFTYGNTVKSESVFENATVGKVYAGGPLNGLVVAVGPLFGTYKEKVDFIGEDGVPNITWDTGEKNTEGYSYVSQSGCGGSNLLAVVQEGLNMDEVVVIGKNSMGDPIYGLKADSEYLKNVYDTSYYEPSEEKKSFEEFMAMRPVVYWIDPFKQWVELRSAKFVPMAECGKPVIYLYPEKTTNVSVKVEPKGGLTFTDPDYNGLWKVRAEPNGELTNLRDGKPYPYLFWEGRGEIYNPPTKGFVITQAEVETFLTDKLSAFGFNAKEIADFKEFWVPRMQGSPYYFVGFLGTSTMDEIAPLTITPKPDTVIRILMDFKPLKEPMAVEGYTIRTPERKGFTVMEWGGVLR